MALTRTAEPPTGVKAIAVFLWVTAALMLIGGALLVIGGGTLASQLQDIIGQAGGAVLIGLGIFMVIWAGVHVLLGIKIWQLRNWARITVLTLAIIGLVLNALGLLSGDISQLIGLAINGAITWYLFRSDVKTLFHATPR